MGIILFSLRRKPSSPQTQASVILDTSVRQTEHLCPSTEDGTMQGETGETCFPLLFRSVFTRYRPPAGRCGRLVKEVKPVLQIFIGTEQTGDFFLCFSTKS